MRRQIWALFISIIAVILSIAAAFSADLWWAAALAVLAVAAWKGARA